jgi:hypothetical protein
MLATCLKLYLKNMAFISKEELEKRLSETENLCARLEVSAPKKYLDTSKFNGNGLETKQKEYSAAQRAIMGAVGLTVGYDKAAEALGVSESAIKDAAKQNYADEENNEHLRGMIYEELTTIRQEAREKLSLCLGLINEESLKLIPDKDRAKTAAQMANQLSNVIERTIHKSPQMASTSHLHLYAPEQRTIQAFTIKQIGEAPSSIQEAEVTQDEQ